MSVKPACEPMWASPHRAETSPRGVAPPTLGTSRPAARRPRGYNFTGHVGLRAYAQTVISGVALGHGAQHRQASATVRTRLAVPAASRLAAMRSIGTVAMLGAMTWLLVVGGGPPQERKPLWQARTTTSGACPNGRRCRLRGAGSWWPSSPSRRRRSRRCGGGAVPRGDLGPRRGATGRGRRGAGRTVAGAHGSRDAARPLSPGVQRS